MKCYNSALGFIAQFNDWDKNGNIATDCGLPG